MRSSFSVQLVFEFFFDKEFPQQHFDCKAEHEKSFYFYNKAEERLTALSKKSRKTLFFSLIIGQTVFLKNKLTFLTKKKKLVKAKPKRRKVFSFGFCFFLLLFVAEKFFYQGQP